MVEEPLPSFGEPVLELFALADQNPRITVCAVAECAVAARSPQFRCLRCHAVAYCCAEHQRRDWPRHQRADCEPPTSAAAQDVTSEQSTDDESLDGLAHMTSNGAISPAHVDDMPASLRALLEAHEPRYWKSLHPEVLWHASVQLCVAECPRVLRMTGTSCSRQTKSQQAVVEGRSSKGPLCGAARGAAFVSLGRLCLVRNQCAYIPYVRRVIRTSTVRVKF